MKPKTTRSYRETLRFCSAPRGGVTACVRHGRERLPSDRRGLVLHAVANAWVEVILRGAVGRMVETVAEFSLHEDELPCKLKHSVIPHRFHHGGG